MISLLTVRTVTILLPVIIRPPSLRHILASSTRPRVCPVYRPGFRWFPPGRFRRSRKPASNLLRGFSSRHRSMAIPELYLHPSPFGPYSRDVLEPAHLRLPQNLSFYCTGNPAAASRTSDTSVPRDWNKPDGCCRSHSSSFHLNRTSLSLPELFCHSSQFRIPNSQLLPCSHWAPDWHPVLGCCM